MAALLFADAAASALNGFSLADALVPADAIIAGGPPRDGIPALSDPGFVSATAATFLKDDDAVLGLSHRGEDVAFPVRILVWHEIVNLTVGGDRVAVTYCPLCRSGIAFVAQAGDRTLEFGVSGLLYNSDMLMFDRDSESLWAQITGMAISGKYRGAVLKQIPLSHTTWSAWRGRHGATRVLSPDTGYERDYSRDPYAEYSRDPGVYFPLAHRSGLLPEKTEVIGLHEAGVARAWPLDVIPANGGVLEDTFRGGTIRIRRVDAGGDVAIETADGERLAGTRTYWFAWFAFFPFTELYRPQVQP